MKQVLLTDAQMNNLVQFLNRVDMKGVKEAIAMVEINNALSTASETVDKKAVD